MQFGSLLKQGSISFFATSVWCVSLLAILGLAAEAGAQTQNQGQKLVFQSASSRGPEQESSVGMARRFYRARRYGEAEYYYRQSLQKDGGGAGTYLWIAHCQYAGGNVKGAIQEYRHVLDTYIGSTEAKVAAQYLARLDPTGKLQGRAADRARGPGSRGCMVAGAACPKSLPERIEIFKPIVGHPELSPSTISLVQDHLGQLPPAVQGMLMGRGVKICITPTLVDRYPNLGYQEGRGYDGHTYKSCPGMYKDSTVIICERFVDEHSNEVQAPLPPGQISDVFYHEIGHAVDACLDSYSSKEEYRHAYYLDIARIPADAASRLAYYMQKSVAGQQESCAEIMAVCLGGGESTAQDVKTYFPLTLSQVMKKLNAELLQPGSEGQIAEKATSHHL